MPQNMNAQGIFEILSKQDVSKLAEFIKRLKENQDHDAVDAKIKPVLEDNLVQGQMCGRGKANRKSNKALSNYCCSFPFAMACALAMIILGSLRLDRCNVEKNIPIAMIVYGVTSVIILIFEFFDALLKIKQDNCQEQKCGCRHFLSFILASLNVFKFIWTIIFAVYLYQHWQPEFDDETSERYCEKGAYLFSFIVITIQIIMMCLALLFGLCVCCCCLCCFAVLAKVLPNRAAAQLEEFTKNLKMQNGMASDDDNKNDEVDEPIATIKA